MSVSPPGALEGLCVIELAHERCAFAGKLLADMGARVIVVEPPGGAPQRTHAPFLDDEPGPERSLAWWHYNTSKLGVTLDLASDEGRSLFCALVAEVEADVVLEAEDPGVLASRRLDYPDLRSLSEGLIMVSLTPFGRNGPRRDEQATDLTVLAGGGPVWNCGYDDHVLPPVRGGGNQGYHTGCHFGVMSLLVALLARDETGVGQQIDVNLHAAANVTTEAGSYDWLVAQSTVQRQTGRHAAPNPSMPSQIRCADGRYVNTGVPPMKPREFELLYEWVAELDLQGEFPEHVFLELGMKRERIDLSKIREDEELQAIFGAGREAVNMIASKLSAYDYFIGAQQRGLPVGVIYSPEEVMEDPHFRERGFAVEVEHEDLGRTFIYPGAPYVFHGSPWRIRRRAPRLGEHDDEILGPLRRARARPGANQLGATR